MILLSSRLQNYRHAYLKIQALERKLEKRYQRLRLPLQRWRERDEEWARAWQNREMLFKRRWTSTRRWLLFVSHIALLLAWVFTCEVGLWLAIRMSGNNGTAGAFALIWLWVSPVPILLLLVYLWASFFRSYETVPPPSTPDFPHDGMQTLTQQWLARVHLEALKDNPSFPRGGSIGELSLVSTLQRALDSRFFALHNVQIDTSLDVDLVLLGPSGIWLLESKYWQGYIELSNGKWRHYRRYHLPGGIPTQEEVPIKWAPDKQVKHIERLVKRLLAKAIPHIDWGSHVTSALVFTHNKADLFIDDSCQVLWGTPTSLLPHLSRPKAKPLPNEILFAIADALLNRERALRGEQPRRDTPAAIDLAMPFYRDRALLLQTLENMLGLAELECQ